LSLGDERFAPALNALTEASAAQDRAIQAMGEADAARQPARGSRERTAHDRQIEHYTYHLKRAKNAVLNAETNLVTLNQRLTTAKAVLARRKSAAAEATSKTGAENPDAAKLALEAVQKALMQAEKDWASAQRQVDDHPKSLADAKNRLPELEAKVAELLAKPDPERVAPTPDDQKLTELQTAARQLQLEAQLAQEKAAQAVAALQGLTDDDTGGNRALAALDQAAPSEVVAPRMDVERMNLAHIYESAVKTEGALAQSYRRLRAMDLAMIRRLPLAKAIQLTEVTKVLRPDLAADLQASVASGEEAMAAREAVQTAKAEVGAMVRLANSLLSQARGLDRSAGSTISVEDYISQFEQWQKMENLAAEDDLEWARDLSAMMGGGGGELGGEGGSGGPGGPGGPGGGGGPGSGGPGNGSGSGGPAAVVLPVACPTWASPASRVRSATDQAAGRVVTVRVLALADRVVSARLGFLAQGGQTEHRRMSPRGSSRSLAGAWFRVACRPLGSLRIAGISSAHSTIPAAGILIENSRRNRSLT